MNRPPRRSRPSALTAGEPASRARAQINDGSSTKRLAVHKTPWESHDQRAPRGWREPPNSALAGLAGIVDHDQDRSCARTGATPKKQTKVRIVARAVSAAPLHTQCACACIATYVYVRHMCRMGNWERSERHPTAARHSIAQIPLRTSSRYRPARPSSARREWAKVGIALRPSNRRRSLLGIECQKSQPRVRRL